jgi:hypothetical protein
MASINKIYKNIIIGNDTQAQQLSGLARMRIEVIIRCSDEPPIFKSNFEYININDVDAHDKFKELIDTNKIIFLHSSTIQKAYLEFAKLMMIALNYKLRDIITLINTYRLNKDEIYDLTKECQLEMLEFEYQLTDTNTYALPVVNKPTVTFKTPIAVQVPNIPNVSNVSSNVSNIPNVSNVSNNTLDQMSKFLDFHDDNDNNVDDDDDEDYNNKNIQKNLNSILEIIGLDHKDTVIGMLKTGMSPDSIINSLI